MFLRLATASRMKASYCWLLKSFSSCCSVSSGVAEERRVVRKMPRWASSPIDHTSSDGRRRVIATVPAVVAGGKTICARSPVGRDAESSGVASSTLWRVKFAISSASRRHQSKSAKGNARRSHPLAVSTKPSPGRGVRRDSQGRSEEHTSELQSLRHLVSRLLLEKKKTPPLTFPAPCA